MDFTFDLPAGRYRLAFAVSGAKGERGVARTVVAVPAPVAGLSMSDVVPVCGPYDASDSRGPVRLAPNVDSRVTGNPRLHAYFEVYGLATDPSGLGHFDLTYEVHALKADRVPWYARFTGARPHARITVRTEESSPGPLRRQFVQLPIEALPAGEYRLDVRVEDRVGGGTVMRSLEFVK